MFKNSYQGKKVLVTGNTGFKGAWLTVWLLQIGARVIGVSKDIPTQPSIFSELLLAEKITYYQEDLRNLDRISAIVADEAPDFVFHLAAQPIVSVSYSDPIETISSNAMGTANLLEALRLSNHPCVAVIITSDKAYDNVEQVWGYKEDDKLGGKDVYSGSKGAAELIIKSYFHSFFRRDESKIRLAIGRAGNVIGGGDWATDRIVVDCMQAWNKGCQVEIRSPKATRPWQHVLEPLSGYLQLGAELEVNSLLNGEAFNFGPRAEQNHSVETLLLDLSKYWDFADPSEAYTITDSIPFHEAGLLKLNCDKALFFLKWKACLDYHETVEYTSCWYYAFYRDHADMLVLTQEQISSYESLAQKRGLRWTE
ncbi:CDP-glucose 4,6-dehydratase [Acidithiobacillus thiooxidans]|uniref:CDP-glucose 4,6-dehydratase n=1 Tax=Acidithiobacillus thiooxidans TaxID=930 RepID=UPI001C078C67|nr:CDP-glucose 4,6-dehydratase [Acidithiobacillus thiooxidans]MBU2838613.1 CDP-glucose 4,6-dehydratase [Acidithiobacillus thiooxidans]MDD2801725.1 CDP-glucose 4,6-dehydratase [Methylococcales bacterium]